MSVEFNNESHEQRAALLYNQTQLSAEPKGIEGWIIKKGIASTPHQARVIMVGLTILFFAISGYLLYTSLIPSPGQTKAQEKRDLDTQRSAGTY